MINPVELRRGSLVLSYDEVVKIRSINTYVTDIVSFYNSNGELDSDYINDLVPIPLTDEWLKKLGFKISGETKDHTVWVNGFVFLTYSKKDDCYFFPINALPIQISYVHHLQNFYILMTGKELKYLKATS